MHLGVGIAHLAEFRLRVNEAVVYAAHWSEDDDTRTLEFDTDEAIDPSSALANGDVELVFDRPVDDLPEVQLGEERVEVVSSEAGRFFGTIDAATLRRLVDAGGGFRVSVSVLDSSSGPVDGDPRSVPYRDLLAGALLGVDEMPDQSHWIQG